jgi:hypothetical protein
MMIRNPSQVPNGVRGSGTAATGAVESEYRGWTGGGGDGGGGVCVVCVCVCVFVCVCVRV